MVLNYAKSNISLYTANYNVPPSVFYDLDIEGNVINVYVYFTNVKPVAQKYAVDPNTLYLAIDGATSVELGAATIFLLDPEQLYSTAGESNLFRINSFYDVCEDELVYPYILINQPVN